MNRIDRQQTIVGAAVLASLAVIIVIIFSVRDDGAASDRYIVIASLPEHSELKAGDAVYMNGNRVGAVQNISDGHPPPNIAVRMKISKKAFKSLGTESVAWIEYSTPEQKTRVLIQPGKPDGRGRFFKIKPVLGIEPPSRESGQ